MHIPGAARGRPGWLGAPPTPRLEGRGRGVAVGTRRHRASVPPVRVGAAPRWTLAWSWTLDSCMDYSIVWQPRAVNDSAVACARLCAGGEGGCAWVCRCPVDTCERRAVAAGLDSSVATTAGTGDTVRPTSCDSRVSSRWLSYVMACCPQESPGPCAPCDMAWMSQRRCGESSWMGECWSGSVSYG